MECIIEVKEEIIISISDIQEENPASEQTSI